MFPICSVKSFENCKCLITGRNPSIAVFARPETFVRSTHFKQIIIINKTFRSTAGCVSYELHFIRWVTLTYVYVRIYTTGTYPCNCVVGWKVQSDAVGIMWRSCNGAAGRERRTQFSAEERGLNFQYRYLLGNTLQCTCDGNEGGDKSRTERFGRGIEPGVVRCRGCVCSYYNRRVTD